MSRPVSIIGAPSSAGAYAPGQEDAPAAFRRHGLVATLEHAGRRVRDRGDVAGFRWRPDPAHPEAMNVAAVARTARAVSDVVADAMADGDAVLVLGGDCTVELGTVAGTLRHSRSVGLVYVDLDVDLNVPDTSDGALDWTGVAHLLDLPGAAAELSALGPRRPMLGPADVLFFGADNVTPPEAATIARLGLQSIGLDEVRANPIAAGTRAVAWGAGHDLLLVHVDVDVLAFTRFPIAENVRRCPGLELGELADALGVLLAAPNWRAATVTEVNPHHAPDERAAFGAMNAVLRDALRG